MVTRISTAANVNALVSRMLDQQTSVNDLQRQIGTGYKSDDYVGLAPDAARLLNTQAEIGRLSNYIRNNDIVATTLNVQLSAATGIDQSARDMRSELITFSGHDLTGASPITVTEVNNIQTRAFNALSQIAYFLNQKVDGKYVFGGGKNDQPPVSFPFDSLKDFQETYDGVSAVFPSTRVANLVNMSFNNNGVTYGSPTIGGKAYGEVSGGAPGTFKTQTMTPSSFGSLIFSNVGTNGKMQSLTPGAFKSLQIGQTISLNNTDPSQGGGTANNGVYTITDISLDGSTVTLDQNVNAGTESYAGTEINLLVPNGTTMALTGSTNGNNGAYTMKWPTNAELVAAGYSLTTGQIVDGGTLFTDPPLVSTTAETVSFNSTSFLTGSNLTTQQKISDTQQIKMDVTGLDPAFEKVIRGLGILAEGDLINNQSRVDDALRLINDALEHSSLQPTELPSDLQGVQDRISLNLKQLSETKQQQTEFVVFLQNRADAIDKADPTETAVRLNAESQALQVSYATLSRVSKMTLLDYL